MIGYLRGFIESGEFKPVVDGQHPLDQIVEACSFVETDPMIGDVVITV